MDRWATDDIVKRAVEKPLASEAERQNYVPRKKRRLVGGWLRRRTWNNRRRGSSDSARAGGSVSGWRAGRVVTCAPRRERQKLKKQQQSQAAWSLGLAGGSQELVRGRSGCTNGLMAAETGSLASSSPRTDISIRTFHPVLSLPWSVGSGSSCYTLQTCSDGTVQHGAPAGRRF